MSNYFEYRLKQIEILLSAFNEEKQFIDEINDLKQERDEIIRHLSINDY